MLLPSFIILYKYAKTRRSVEASYLMFFWTQFGALFISLLIIYLGNLTGSYSFNSLYTTKLTKLESNVIFLFLILGFGVKLPIWPFYDWLPKAHVEASTNFSIFLSGVLVKLAFFGFFKFLIFLSTDISFFFIIPYLFYGIVDSTIKLSYQVDIKKLVAYSTVVEMHWLLICISSGNRMLWYSGFCMLIAHALISTNFFLMVDSITRRFKTRYIYEVSGVCFIYPKLFIYILINSIIFLGFPTSLFFVSEFIFFSFLFDMMPILSVLSLFFIYLLLGMFFFKIWVNVLLGSVNINIKKIKMDLDSTENLIFSFFIFLVFILSFSNNIFIF